MGKLEDPLFGDELDRGRLAGQQGRKGGVERNSV